MYQTLARRFRVSLPLSLCVLAALWLSGCGAHAESKPQLTVFAASSLTDAFEELGGEFEEQNPGVEVRFNFAGSSALLAQIRHGAPADIFAPADGAKMDQAWEAGLVQRPRVFANNLPVILVPAENPAGVESLRDLADPGADLVLSQKGVPIAGYAEEVLERAEGRYGDSFKTRVVGNTVSREADVRAASNKVVLGEADATFVYASDVTPAVRDEVKVVEIPEGLNVVATYPIAVVEDPPNRALAREWTELVLGVEGQRVMEKWGFQRVSR
ncbi:MAG: molybdate ABC transporter substrate-binding protein [Rubrobacteraceae bacterium]